MSRRTTSPALLGSLVSLWECEDIVRSVREKLAREHSRVFSLTPGEYGYRGGEPYHMPCGWVRLSTRGTYLGCRRARWHLCPLVVFPRCLSQGGQNHRVPGLWMRRIYWVGQEPEGAQTVADSNEYAAEVNEGVFLFCQGIPTTYIISTQMSHAHSAHAPTSSNPTSYPDDVATTKPLPLRSQPHEPHFWRPRTAQVTCTQKRNTPLAHESVDCVD